MNNYDEYFKRCRDDIFKDFTVSPLELEKVVEVLEAIEKERAVREKLKANRLYKPEIFYSHNGTGSGIKVEIICDNDDDLYEEHLLGLTGGKLR